MLIIKALGLVAIKNIKAGDKVTSTNTDTFETAYKSVLETYIPLLSMGKKESVDNIKK